LFWLPNTDDPDLWSVVACSSTGRYEEVPGSMLEALIAVVRGDAGREAFPEALYEEPLQFIPMDLRVSAQFGLISPDNIPPGYH